MARNNGRKKNKDNPGQFEEGSERASRAGKKGGEAAQESGKAHKLTDEERSRGGKRSSGGGRS